MYSTQIQEIPLGPIHIRFLVDGTAEPAAHRSLSMFEFTVEPGARVPIAHSHDAYDETAYALEGALTLTLWDAAGNPQRIETKPGDHVFIPRGVVHRFDNFSNAPTRTLAVITPGILGAAYFREVGAVVAQAIAQKTPPDPRAVGEVMLRHGLTPRPDFQLPTP
jgi:quercetin dioxygenase-like cupin family protein